MPTKKDSERILDLEQMVESLNTRLAKLEALFLPQMTVTDVRILPNEGLSPADLDRQKVGDGGPFKLKRKKFTGYENTPTGNPNFQQRKVKKYGEWEEIPGGFSALHKAIGYISTLQRGTDMYSVFMTGKRVYTI